jgi:fructose transport system permease protein
MVTPTASEDGASSLVHQGNGLARVQHALHRYPTISPLLVLILSSIVFTIVGHGNFQKPSTIGIMLQQTAVLAAVAIGQTLIILTAGVDLSVGTAMILSHIVMAKLFIDQGMPTIVALLLGLVVGVVMGAFHGWIVTKIGLPPFIVTLGTFYIYQSLATLFIQGQTLFPKDDDGGTSNLLLWTGRNFKIGSMQITTGVILVLVMYIVFAFILSNTAWGQRVYATGDDREAARLAGIDTKRVLLSVYMVAGLLYGIGAWVQLGRSGSASTNAATDVNLESITAVVIGGTSLFGGRGRLWGTLVGALIVVVFRLGLKLAEVDVAYQNLTIGMLILVAVALDQWIRKVAK